MSSMFDKIGTDVASGTGDAQSDWQARRGSGRDLVLEARVKQQKAAADALKIEAARLTTAELGEMPSWGEPFIKWKARMDEILKTLH